MLLSALNPLNSCIIAQPCTCSTELRSPLCSDFAEPCSAGKEQAKHSSWWGWTPLLRRYHSTPPLMPGTLHPVLGPPRCCGSLHCARAPAATILSLQAAASQSREHLLHSLHPYQTQASHPGRLTKKQQEWSRTDSRRKILQVFWSILPAERPLQTDLARQTAAAQSKKPAPLGRAQTARRSQASPQPQLHRRLKFSTGESVRAAPSMANSLHIYSG